ncbi:butyrophilin subfamily 2 member A1-like isoform X2 [Maylandia zebra]|uniref:butyrophilin subfamily 2 member A1-like isoform X2 n=1 Tax=Maylandia zebra TaxID=106582 RepID=UPI00403CBA96
MAAGTSASLCWLIFVFASVYADQKIITAGQDVTLPCRAPNNNIIVVEWSRADLGEEYVLYYKDAQFITDEQHPSFKNRVTLQDRQMKDGDVSLILKNVTTNDNGTYECRVVLQVRGPMTHINTIHLHVVPPGQTGGDTEDGGKEDGGKEDRQRENGSVGLKVCLTVSSMLLLVAVGFAV